MQLHRLALRTAAAAVLIAACESSGGEPEPVHATTGSTGAGAGDDDFCRAVDEFKTAFAELDPSLSPGERNLRVNELTVGLADQAPDSLHDAIAIIQATDPTSPADMDSAEYQAAVAELGAYIETECGIATDR